MCKCLLVCVCALHSEGLYTPLAQAQLYKLPNMESLWASLVGLWSIYKLEHNSDSLKMQMRLDLEIRVLTVCEPHV